MKRTNDGKAGRFTFAALEPWRWLEALEELAISTGSSRAQLIGFRPGYQNGFNWISGEAPPTMVADFAKVAPADNFRIVANERFAHLPILHEHHYDSVRHLLPSTAYVELSEQWGLPFGCQTNLWEDAGGLIGLALLRTRRDGQTTIGDRSIFGRARSDAAAAVALQIALEEQGFQLLAGTFEAMCSACFVLDAGMRVRALTPAADDLLRRGTLSLLEQRLHAPPERGGSDLNTAMQSLLTGMSTARRVVLSSPGSQQVLVQLHRLPLREWSLGFAPAVIVIAKEGLAPQSVSADVLQSSFGFTGAEAAIAQLLAEGVGGSEICRQRNIARETLRTHLRAVYSKLGVVRESEAVRLVLKVLDRV